MKLAIQKVFFILLSVSTLFSVSFIKNNRDTVVFQDSKEDYFTSDDIDVEFEDYLLGNATKAKPYTSSTLSFSVNDNDGAQNDFSVIIPTNNTDGNIPQNGFSNLGAYLSWIDLKGKGNQFQMFIPENEADIFGSSIIKDAWWNTGSGADINGQKTYLQKLYFSIKNLLFIPVLVNTAADKSQDVFIDNIAIQFYSFNFAEYINYVIDNYGSAFWKKAPSIPMQKIINKSESELREDGEENLIPFKQFFEIQFDPIYLNPLNDPSLNKEDSLVDDYLKADLKLSSKDTVFNRAMTYVYEDGGEYLVAVGLDKYLPTSPKGKELNKDLWITDAVGTTHFFNFSLDQEGNIQNYKKVYRDPLMSFSKSYQQNGHLYFNRNKKIIAQPMYLEYKNETGAWEDGRGIMTLDFPENVESSIDPNEHYTVYSGVKENGDSGQFMFMSEKNIASASKIHNDLKMYSFSEEIFVPNTIGNNNRLVISPGNGSKLIIDFTLLKLEFQVQKNPKYSYAEWYLLGEKPAILFKNTKTFEYKISILSNWGEEDASPIFTDISEDILLANDKIGMQFDATPVVMIGKNKYAFTFSRHSSIFKFVSEKVKLTDKQVSSLNGQKLFINNLVDATEIAKIDEIPESEMTNEEKNIEKDLIYKNGMFDFILQILFPNGSVPISTNDLVVWMNGLEKFDDAMLNLTNKPVNWRYIQEDFQVISKDYVIFKYDNGAQFNDIKIDIFSSVNKGVDIKEIIGSTSTVLNSKFSYKENPKAIEGSQGKEIWYRPDYLEFSAHIKYKENDVYSKLESDLNEAWAKKIKEKPEFATSSDSPFNDEFGLNISKNFPAGGVDSTIEFSAIEGEDVIKASFSSNDDDFSYFSTINIYLEGITNKVVDSETAFRNILDDNDKVQAGWIKADDNVKSITNPVIEQVQLIFAKKSMYFDGEIKVGMDNEMYLDTDNENPNANMVNLDVTMINSAGDEENFVVKIKLVEVKQMDISVNFVTNPDDKKLSININNYEVIKKANKKVTFSVNRVVENETRLNKADSDEISFNEETGSIIIDQNKFYTDSLVDISISVFSDEEGKIKFGQDFNQRKATSPTEKEKSNMLWIYIGAAAGGLIVLIILIGTTVGVTAKKRKAIRLEKSEILEFKKEYYRNLFINSVEEISNLDDSEVNEIQKEVQRIESNLNDDLEEPDFFEEDEDGESNISISENTNDEDIDEDVDEEEFDIDSLI